MSGAFAARWTGFCTDCEEGIRPGEQIVTDGHDGYEHVRCRQEPRPNPVCQTCWLTHPEGACDR